MFARLRSDDRLASPTLAHLAHPTDAIDFEMLSPLVDCRTRDAEGLGNDHVGNPVAGHQQTLYLSHGTVRQ
jgi:hypothetical protein